MAAAVQWRSGGATDTGLLRASNEDRYWIDDENGIFLVVDGVGGRAAGETAAETAVAAIREELPTADGNAGSAEDRVRRAIAAANNRIYAIARDSDELRGMACVLTLALVDSTEMVIGHVGDSRLYLIWNGAIRKLTPDHSPVGEEEDAGELTEAQAMLHPRRNEVFRDVGTRPHAPGEDGFIEIRRCQFKPEAAFLLCSDGLSDALPSAAIKDIVERYQGDPAQVACDLVEAANEAGGKDNITALFIAGSDFRPGMREARARHATTRMRPEPADAASGGIRRIFTGRAAFLFYGLLWGMLLGVLLASALHAPKG
ncbi:MAG TPA: protein phosphatase 2C domain-containing protein [Bryobacteraceae bacterium]|nr:protein phosphatase 2C domain-containing protein [Bryobacteraceae bacterium]